jgi:hypothetical protein
MLINVRSQYGNDGRLPLPDVASWDIFPFEGQLLGKPLEDAVFPEPPRHGEAAADCGPCRTGDDDYIWVDERWRLKVVAGQCVPAFILEPRQHADLGDLDDSLAAELGCLVVRVERAVASVPGVGRVHVNRWGDGGAHLHVWFFARPEGLLQLRGSCLPDWLDVLPPLPPEDSDAITRHVVGRLESQ